MGIVRNADSLAFLSTLKASNLTCFSVLQILDHNSEIMNSRGKLEFGGLELSFRIMNDVKHDAWLQRILHESTIMSQVPQGTACEAAGSFHLGFPIPARHHPSAASCSPHSVCRCTFLCGIHHASLPVPSLFWQYQDPTLGVCCTKLFDELLLEKARTKFVKYGNWK